MPHVSVIIPTYNRSQFLAGALTSVLGQSYKDLEILVIDDGGTDDAAAVVAGFHGAPIRYLRHDHRRGSAASRNTGIRHATGEYIAFLDDDHEWYPEKLMRQMQCMLASPAEVGGVYTGCFIIERSTGKIRDQVVPGARGDVHQALLAGNCIGSASSMLMRRSCINEAGCFDEGLPSFYDYDLWLRAGRKYQFECIREPQLKYYVDGNEIGTNSEAFARGLELMFKKYGESPAFRRKCSAYYLRLGVQLCETRQFNAGRKALVRAARLQPLVAEPYLYLLLAVLGGDSVRLARQTKARLLPRVKSRAIRMFAENV
jgi:glycosyltransferase involved in cell wall biosynthesis